MFVIWQVALKEYVRSTHVDAAKSAKDTYYVGFEGRYGVMLLISRVRHGMAVV